MHLAEGDTWIGRVCRTFQGQQYPPAGADQGEEPVERHIMTKYRTWIGSSQLADEQLVKFWSGAVLRQQQCFLPQFAPMNNVAGGQRMVLGKSDDDAFAPDQ